MHEKYASEFKLEEMDTKSNEELGGEKGTLGAAWEYREQKGKGGMQPDKEKDCKAVNILDREGDLAHSSEEGSQADSRSKELNTGVNKRPLTQIAL